MFKKDLYNIFSILSKKQKIQVYIVFIFSLFSVFFDLIGIGMIIPLTNIILGNTNFLLSEIEIINKFLNSVDQTSLLFYAIVFFLIFYIVKTLYSTFVLWYQKKFIYLTSKDFGAKLLTKYFNESYLDFLKRKQSELTRNIVFESGIFVTAIIQSLINLSVELLLLIGISALLIFYDPNSAIVLLFTTVVIGGLYILFIKKKLNILGQQRQNLTSEMLKILSESFILQKEVRILNKQNYIQDLYNDKATKIAKISIFEQVINNIPKIWFELIAVIGLAFIVFYFLFFNIEINKLIPLLGLYAAAIFRLIPCANRIIGGLNNVIHNLPSFRVLFDEFKSIRYESFDKSEKTEKFIKFDNFIYENFNPNLISLKNISFSFGREKNNEKLFNKVSLDFEKNHITALIGKSGCGKSTLANIISGLITNYDGRLLINNRDNFNIDILKRSVGYVPQITNLLDTSLANNICFGLLEKEIKKNKLINIIEKVELTELVKKLKNGLDTVIGDQGLTLSGGQRQKIALARTLYLDPKIIIFDESTNSLDKKSEEQFFKNILKFKHEKIIICITHDMGLSKYFDKIYKISQGSIEQLNK